MIINDKPRAGDIVGVESRGFVAWTIEKVELRQNYTKEQAKTTHIAIVIDDNGTILEAEGSGIRKNNLSFYDNLGWKYHILRHTTADGLDIAQKARELAKKKNDKYRDYDFKLVTGLLFVGFGLDIKHIQKFNSGSRYICSEFAVEVFHKLGIIMPRPLKAYFPAEFIKWADEGFFNEIVAYKSFRCATRFTQD